MGVVRTGESEYDKELEKWNAPYRFREFPKMVYKAVKKDNGKVVCMEPVPGRLDFATDAAYLQAAAQAENRLRACHQIVQDDREERIAKGQGWCENPSAALAQFEREEQAIGDAAAELNASVRRMSAKAQAEHVAADEATHEHVPDVKAPKKRPYRRRVKVTRRVAQPQTAPAVVASGEP